MIALSCNNYVQESFTYLDGEVPLSVFENCVGTGNESLYLHCHNCMEVIYIKAGSGFIYADLQKFPVNAGDFVLLSPGQLHSGASRPHDKMFCKAIVFDLGQLKEGKLDYIYQNFIYKFFSHEITVPTVVQKKHSFYEELRRDFFSIFDEFIEKEEAYECFLKGYLLHLLGTLYRNAQKSTEFDQVQKHGLEKIKRALAYIAEHYQQNLSIDEIASVSGYSKYYFMHFFKRATGLTITQYINIVRLDKAAWLLLNSEYNITEISAEVGFSNVSYFIKQFTLRYQKTPKKFRS